jgi:hypothetical protein
MNFVTTPGDLCARAKRRSFSKLKTATFGLKLGREGKFTAKSSGWDKNRLFLHGHKLEVPAKNGRRC